MMALLLIGSAAGPAAAQESEPGEERCACVDPGEIREQVRTAMEEAREEVERARKEIEHAREHARHEVERARRQVREQVREMRHRGPARAHLGVGISYDQGVRWDSVGVRVTRVPEDGPAAEAGIREGDVLVALDGRRLTAPLDEEVEDDLEDEGSRPVQRLVTLLRRHEPGDEVDVTLLRDGSRTTTTVELGRMPRMGPPPGPAAPDGPHVFRFRGGPDAPHPPMVPPEARREIRREIRRGLAPLRWRNECGELAENGGPFPPRGCVAGVQVAPMSPELGAYFGTDDGVLITRVAEGSSLGLRPGDVILAVDDRVVDEPEDLRRILRSYEEDEEARLRIRRSGEERTVTAAVP